MLFGHRINKYYLKHIFAYIVGIAFLIIIDYVQALMPEQIGRFASGIENNNFTIELLKSIVTTILIYGVIIALSRLIWRICLIGSARKIEKELKEEMFEHSQKLSQEYYSKQKVGAMMSLYTSDVETVRQSLGFGIVMFIDAVFLGLVSIIKMLQVNVFLTLLSLIPMLVIGIGGIWFSKSFEKSYLMRQKAYEDLSEFTLENYSGISVVKAYVKERRELKEFVKKNKNVYNASMSFTKKLSLLESLIETLIALSIILIFAVGGYLAYKGQMSGAEIVEFYNLFFLLIWPMIALAQILNNLSQGKASLKRISEYLDTKVTVKDSEDVLNVNEISGDIEFKNLSFKYPDTEVNVLNEINLKIKNGQTVGFIGRTGCGKSSIVELLLRTYNIENDSLYLGDNDIMKLPIRTVRKNIGYVPQSNFLYSDTVANNIAFGLDREVSQEEIENIAAMADIDRNIKEFPLGYSTMVGERGTTLSGGQKQRISIARALIKDPKILILDDSVSAVDTKTEVTILKNLRKIRKNKTTLIIGHRISTMKSLDMVVLLDEGRIVATGKHNDLAASSPLYQKMIKQQELEG